MERGEERGEYDCEGGFAFNVTRWSPPVAAGRRCGRANDGRFGRVF